MDPISSLYHYTQDHGLPNPMFKINTYKKDGKLYYSCILYYEYGPDKKKAFIEGSYCETKQGAKHEVSREAMEKIKLSDFVDNLPGRVNINPVQGKFVVILLDSSKSKQLSLLYTNFGFYYGVTFYSYYEHGDAYVDDIIRQFGNDPKYIHFTGVEKTNGMITNCMTRDTALILSTCRTPVEFIVVSDDDYCKVHKSLFQAIVPLPVKYFISLTKCMEYIMETYGYSVVK